MKRLFCFMLCTCICAGCGSETKISFPSPDGQRTVHIKQPRAWNYLGLSLWVEDSTGSRMLRELKGDSIIDFAHCVWPNSGTIVTCFVWGTAAVEYSYDVASNKAVDFKLTLRALEESIATTYGVKLPVGTGRVLDWAASPAAATEFRRRHPRARTR